MYKRQAKWGHKAIAITDHGVVQAFPEAFGAAKKAGIKLIPGCEGYLIDDRAMIVERADARPIAQTHWVVLDVETTGLSPQNDTIIEFGAVRFELSLIHIWLVGGVAAPVGDLTASMVKRYCGIKDYGSLFPGHGGMMDRIDSVVFTGAVVYSYFALVLNVFSG